MPELPEVQVCVNQLAARLCGRRIRRVVVTDAKIRLRVRELTGRCIRRVWRRAKFIVMDLDGGQHLLVHLRMTGWFDFVRPPRYRLAIETARGTAYFVDSRRFGKVRLVDARGLTRTLAALGPEPLNGPCTLAGLGESTRPVKVALLDQRLVAGWGTFMPANRCGRPASIRAASPAG